MAQFKILAGTHAEGREIFRKGDVVSSELDLVAVFGSNKFEAVNGPVPVEPEPAPVEVVEEEEEADEEDEDDDVTASIRGVQKYIKDGLVVKETEAGFWIYDDGVLVNEDPLQKSKVKAAVVDYFG